MKRKLMIGSLIVLGIGLTLNAAASEIDCFPLCTESSKVELKVEPAASVKLDTVDIAAPHGDALDAVPSDQRVTECPTTRVATCRHPSRTMPGPGGAA